MAKRIDTNRLRIAVVGGIMIMLILAAIASMLLSGGNASAATAAVEPAFAPAEYAYPEYFTEIDLTDGFRWTINDQGQFVLTDKDDDQYVILPDGSVYQIGDDGRLDYIEDQDVIDELMNKAAEASEESDTAADYFETDLPLTDAAIKDLVGDEITPEEFRILQEAGLTPEEIAALIAQGLDPEEILQALQAGISPEDIEAYLDRMEDIFNRLEDSIAGTGMTIDDLLAALEDMGMTPEQYLAALERMNSQNTAPVATAPAITASSMPSLTISLGGNESSVQEKEDEYQAYLDSLNAVADPTQMLSAISGINGTSDYVAQNDQAGKQEFMSSFASNSGADQLTQYDVAPGTVVTMILKTGINSDLPGQIVAEVTQNVYDSLTGTNLLIPKGTRLIATYSSSVSWGQKRALVAWTQLIRPDGFILNLPGLPGIDGQGYAGYNDKVDNHTWDLIWGAALASILDVGAGEVQAGLEDSDMGLLGLALSQYSGELTSAAQEYLKRIINQQPTLTIRPGRTIKLLVTEKLTLRPYQV